MTTEIRLPQWGEMTSAIVTNWLKKEGDQINKGEPLLELETEKINSEMESPVSGVLISIVAHAGETVDVGSVLAVLGEPGEYVRPRSEGPGLPESSPRPTTGEDSSTKLPRRIQVEPGARRLARELGITIHAVEGTGPQGRITVEDVQRAAKAVSQAEVSPSVSGSLTGMRRAIAERMLRSSHETAPLTLTMEVDVTGLEELREGLRNRNIRPLHIIVKAVAMTLKEHPALNAHLRGNQLERLAQANIGVAVALDDGLIVPVVRIADQKSVTDIASEVGSLAGKARKGALSVEEVTGGTFTITNLGASGIDVFTPIINQPEVAILGIGRIAERPAVHKGTIVKRSMMWLSLTFDHRAVDGAPAAAFLGSLRDRLEDLSWLIP